MASERFDGRQSRRAAARRRWFAAWALAAALAAPPVWAGSGRQAPLPDAPLPQAASPVPSTPPPHACAVKTAARAAILLGESAASQQPRIEPCPSRLPIVNWYARFLNGPEVKPLTPAEKARLAARNLMDPFNLITIFGEAGISVAANPHSSYGPGMPGYGRYAGVSFTQDMTGEFFGTFLIPSLVRQDPHYHRMPNASIKRRVAHAVEQIVWTQGDNGRGMINYADLAGFAIDDEIGNLYVPGQQTRITASAARYGIGLATAPIDNFITEFLPDVARRIHVRVVLVQRIINQVARSGDGSS